MRNCLLLVAVLLVACSSDSKGTPDAGADGTGGSVSCGKAGPGPCPVSTGGTGGSVSTSGTGGGGTGGSGTGGSGTGGSGTGGMTPAPVPDSGTPDSGPPDPCDTVANKCTTVGVKCSSDSLVTCEEDADGCLVETSIDCTTGGTDYCDASAATPACAACADLADACAAAATSCDTNTLVSCAADANGCLVTTETDCAAAADYGFCSPTPSPAACVDPCLKSGGGAKDNVCVTDVTMCAADILVECKEDLEGCPIATRTNCVGNGNNYCDATVNPPVCANDPCLGRANPCLTAGVTCRENEVITCGLGTGPLATCLVETSVDCTTMVGTTTCGDVGAGTLGCVACNNDQGCSAAGKTCGGSNTLITCADTDADTCLNRVDEACGTDFDCDVTTGCTYNKTDACDSAIEKVLRAPGVYGPYDTAAVGVGNDYGPYASCPESIFSVTSGAPDLLFAVEVAPRTVVTVGLQDQVGFDADIAPGIVLLTECGVGTTVAEASCVSISVTSVKYANEGNTTIRVYVVVDANEDGTPATDNVGTFKLNVGTRPLACGDGNRDGTEACDDGNIFSADGCTPTCTLEAGYDCTAANPSVCTQRPANGTCANITCDVVADPFNLGLETCCSEVQVKCGTAYPFIYGASCFERTDVAVVPDARCLNETGFFSPTLNGCCRADKKCGLTALGGVGCVERTEVWTKMQDGAGAFLYGGPFDEILCP